MSKRMKKSSIPSVPGASQERTVAPEQNGIQGERSPSEKNNGTIIITKKPPMTNRRLPENRHGRGVHHSQNSITPTPPEEILEDKRSLQVHENKSFDSLSDDIITWFSHFDSSPSDSSESSSKEEEPEDSSAGSDLDLPDVLHVLEEKENQVQSMPMTDLEEHSGTWLSTIPPSATPRRDIPQGTICDGIKRFRSEAPENKFKR